MTVTRFGRPIIQLTSGMGATTQIPPGGGAGQGVVSNGSNGSYWASVVQTITANGSNTLLGPFVNFASGSGISFAVASNTLTITGSSGSTGSSLNISHLITATTFPIIAHRGDINPVDGYPECTVEAMRQAMTRGAHGVEFDVIRSSDGTWWVMHDTTVDRTTDGTGAVSSKTDANMAALNIDGGYGYNAGRHGTSLDVPTLAQLLTAVLPYDPILYFDLKETTDAAHTALAQYIVAQGLVERSILLGITVTGCAAARVVSANLEIELPTFIDGNPQNYSYIDRGLTEQSVVVNAAYVNARAPDPIDSYIDADAHYGDDETTYLTNMWTRGVRAYLTNDLPNALLLRNTIVLDTASGAPSGAAGGDLSGTYPNPSVVDDSHSHTTATAPGGAGVGELLILDTPAGSPLVFADILQNEAGTALLYADP